MKMFQIAFVRVVAVILVIATVGADVPWYYQPARGMLDALATEIPACMRFNDLLSISVNWGFSFDCDTKGDMSCPLGPSSGPGWMISLFSTINSPSVTFFPDYSHPTIYDRYLHMLQSANCSDPTLQKAAEEAARTVSARAVSTFGNITAPPVYVQRATVMDPAADCVCCLKNFSAGGEITNKKGLTIGNWSFTAADVISASVDHSDWLKVDGIIHDIISSCKIKDDATSWQVPLIKWMRFNMRSIVDQIIITRDARSVVHVEGHLPSDMRFNGWSVFIMSFRAIVG